MDAISVGNRILQLPSLIPSISSFETQLSPAGALRLQTTLREPVSLISAYDLVADETGDLPRLCREYRRVGVMFLDSGGYETSRVRKYAHYEWTLETFLAAAEPDLFDFAFSFDLFPTIGMSWEEHADAVEELLSKHDRIPQDRLIPVVHVVDDRGQPCFDTPDVPKLISRVAGSHAADLIAIPERELGAGLPARVAMAKGIATELDKEKSARLHLLGCGNPMSFAAFVDAGVASCDGLEWCRTYCADDMRLYHYQHTESVGRLAEPISAQTEFLMSQVSDYYLWTAIANLNNFAAVVRDIQQRTGPAIALVEKAFGETIRL